MRAAVLGANDGIISTASLIVGVASAAATQSDVLIAGVAGLVAGAMSMAAGEYVSVSSQSDTEQADLSRERKELSESPESELDELAEIYVKRGVEQGLARQVARQLMAKDALAAHARDELGMSEITTARPVQAALTSAAMFSTGAAMPLLMVVLSPASALIPVVSALRADHCPGRPPLPPAFCPLRSPVIEDDEPKPDGDVPLSGRSRRTRCRGCRARQKRRRACGLCKGSPSPRGAGSQAHGSCSDKACSCRRPRDKRRTRPSAPR